MPRIKKSKSYKNHIVIFSIVLFVICVIFVRERRIERTYTNSVSVPKEVTDIVDKSMQSSDNILAVQVIAVDLDTNTRRVIYTKIRKRELSILYDSFLKDASSQNIPFFTNNAYLNSNLIRLMSGEYFCTPYKLTLSAEMLPSSAKYIASVCAVSIPPYFGNFKGIIAIFLENEPSEYESEMIEVVIKEISMNISDFL